jgi:hypothetical protein
MKNSKRILSVIFKHSTDTDPDLSHLGEYANKPSSEFSIDRDHALDCVVNQPANIKECPDCKGTGLRSQAYDPGDASGKYCSRCEGSGEVAQYPLYECGSCGAFHPWDFDGDCRDDDNCFAAPEEYARKLGTQLANVPIYTMEQREDNCTCGKRGDRLLREYQYFNPSFNYVDKQGKLLPPNSPAEVRRYVRQDYKRMEEYNKGYWRCIGIRAVATVGIGTGDTGPHGSSISLQQKVTSGGIWGVESDSDDDYIKELEQEELAQLRQQLKALGFNSRAISAAVKNAERKDA